MAVLLFTTQNLFDGNIWDTLRHYVAGISIEWPDLSDQWAKFSEWLSQPHVLAMIFAWWITFTIVCTIIMSLGFGPIGIIPGTAAAAFQAFMYGGFTPAGGLFATLTSMAMVGTLMPAVLLISSFVASLVAAMVWVFGVGR